ncbi:MAG TPA: Rieske 2Fe-2S domain-containing protein [Candidatus Acidoferrales bacterium]|nr:Rieske 2Fe-2S domain-containing protein [Candidatus Acidoferrales bacterium]
MTDAEAKDHKTAGTAPTAAKAQKAAATNGKPVIEPVKLRRRVIWAMIWGFVAANAFMIMRFFFPRTLFEPKSIFTVGTPPDFGLGVDTRFQQAYRIWVVRKPERLFVIYARCTHLGCTPDWKESENKFKCPCHGSGYDSDGINFEGPAPRPMDRAHVELNAQGQIVVDVNRLYTCERGKPCHFDDEGAYLVV